MPWTVKDAAQAVARTIGVDVPDSFFGNSDDTAQRFTGAIIGAGRHLSRKDWRALTFEGTITLVPGTLEYALPTSPAFDHMKYGAMDRNLFRAVRGPVSSLAYQTDKADVSVSGFWAPFAIRVSAANRSTPQIVFASDPARSGLVAFDYVTKEWAFDGSAYTDTPASDGAQPLFSRDLFELGVQWRMLRAIGRTYVDQRAEYEDEEDACYGKENGEVLNLTSSAGFSQVPEGSWPGSVALDSNGLPL